MVWWKTVASVVAFLLGVGVSAPALAGLNATWVDKAVAASQTVESGEGAEDNSEYRKSNTPKVVGEAETPKSVTATPGIQSGIATVVPAVETNLETTVTPVVEWPEGGFTGETTVTYNANGYTFPDGSTTNKVTTRYENYKEVVKYAHSDNVDDAGVQNGGYGNNKAYSRVVTIHGAARLQVDLTYQTEANNMDWVCAYAGSGVGDARCSTAGSLTGKLGGKTKETKSFTVDGDSVTFWFRSDGGIDNFYGFYAVVSASLGVVKESTSGGYSVPVDKSGELRFSRWNTLQDGSGKSLGGGEVFSPSDLTVYAQWGTAYNKWNTVGWRVTDDGVLKIRPWEGDTGITGSINNDDSYSVRIPPWYDYRQEVKKVESFGNIILNEKSDKLFYSFSNLVDISGLSDWDVSNVSQMVSMFEGCSGITNLGALSQWDTSNVVDMRCLFRKCKSLSDISGLSSWDIENVKYLGGGGLSSNNSMNIWGMFAECTSLVDISPVVDWNTSNVINMSFMFYRCGIRDTNALGKWDVGNVTAVAAMFADCYNLANIDALGNWNTGNFRSLGTRGSWDTDKYGIFSGCSKITSLDSLRSWDVSNVTSMFSAFDGCSGITSLDPLGDWDVSNVEVVRRLFRGCSGVVSVAPLENWNIGKVRDLDEVFSGCRSVTGLAGISNWDVSNVTSMYFTFKGCIGLSDLEGISGWNVEKVVSLRGTFSGCSGLVSLEGLGKWRTSSLKYLGLNSSNASGTFQGCSNLVDLHGLENWDIGNVVSIEGLFNGCNKLSSLQALESWDVSNVENMENTFSYCSSLKTLEGLESWKTVSLKTIGSEYYDGIFMQCTSLVTIGAIGNWDVSKVTNVGCAFSYLNSIVDLSAFSKWDMSSVVVWTNVFTHTPTSSIERIGIPSLSHGGLNFISHMTAYEKFIIDTLDIGPFNSFQIKSEMQTNPDAFQEGTIWVRYTPSYFLDFNPNGGIGSTKSLMTLLASTATLPDSTFLRFGYKFIGWTAQPDPISDMNPLMKPGQQFRPASPTDAARYTLYAQWEKLGDTSNLPESSQAGILPGWVQVGSENTNGLIPPMDMAIASFINKYSPDQTSITFRFLKLLDGNVPSASDTFTFDIYDESGKLVQTATNVGSTVTFAPLGFSKAGVFTYFISERQDPSNKINEDDNVIQATVTVVEEDGKLKATAQLLGDTTFRNETKPAELTISKKVVLPEWSDITDDDQETFKFHVTLKKDASPLSGTFDGVTFDESGTATIEVKGNTQKTIKGIPAGTTYTVNEVDIPQGYSNTDKTNTNGNLLADSSVTSEWENTYTPVDATAQLQASKKYFDQSNTEFNLKGGEFGFSACEIIDSNTSTGCVTATNDRTGKVEFPVLTYSTPGIHTYRITEDITSIDKSIAFDRKAYTVTVEVADNGEGSLVSKVRYNTADGSVPVFVNRNTVMSALPVTGSYAVWAVVFAAVVSVVWFVAPGRRRHV